jgi:hypothetical protein
MSRLEVARTERRLNYTTSSGASAGRGGAAGRGRGAGRPALRHAKSLLYDWRKRRRCAELVTAEPLRIVPYGMAANIQSTRADPGAAISAHLLELEPASCAPAPHRRAAVAAGA